MAKKKQDKEKGTFADLPKNDEAPLPTIKFNGRGRIDMHASIEDDDAPGLAELIDPDGLKPLHRAFLNTYINNGGNGTKAYFATINSKTTPGSAAACASELLSRPKIRNALQKAVRRHQHRWESSAERIELELHRIAYQQHADIYNADGSIKAPHEMDPDVGATIASSETEELFAGVGEERQQIGVTRKVRRQDKLGALKLLAKMKGLLIDNKNVNVNARVLTATVDLTKVPLESRQRWLDDMRAAGLLPSPDGETP